MSKDNNPSHERDDDVVNASWNDSERVLAQALQELPLLETKIDALVKVVPDDAREALRQVDLASRSVQQKITMAAAKRHLKTVGEHGDVYAFDDALFECGEDVNEGQYVQIARVAVVKETDMQPPIVVLRGWAEAEPQHEHAQAMEEEPPLRGRGHGR